MRAQKIVGQREPPVRTDDQQPVPARGPKIRHAARSRVVQPPSIALRRSDCTGVSPIQIRVSARLNASPGTLPFAEPFKPIFVAPSTKSKVMTFPSLNGAADLSIAMN